MKLDRWLEPYRLEWSNRLNRLERHLERTAIPTEISRPAKENP